MGPFGIPWTIAIVYMAGFIGVPIVVEILIHTKWWKQQLNHYYSYNQKK